MVRASESPDHTAQALCCIGGESVHCGGLSFLTLCKRSPPSSCMLQPSPLSHCVLQAQSAGSKIQSSSGRLLFAGHATGRNGPKQSQVCIWFSDDGGETYNTSALFKGNEISMADLGGCSKLGV